MTTGRSAYTGLPSFVSQQGVTVISDSLAIEIVVPAVMILFILLAFLARR